MLLKFEVDGVVKGWANAVGQEEADLKKQGYVESSEKERQSILAKKNKPIEEPATIEPAREAVKGKPGRKPKLSLGGVHGNRTDQG